MDVTGSNVGSPFLVPPAPDGVEHHRPPVDDVTMQRLRTPFAAAPSDTLECRVVGADTNDYRG